MDQTTDRRSMLTALGGFVVAGVGLLLPKRGRAAIFKKASTSTEPATGLKQQQTTSATSASSLETQQKQHVAPASVDEPQPDPETQVAEVAQLVAPLRSGSAVADGKVLSVHGVRLGAAAVAVEAFGGWKFQVDICKRDRNRAAPEAVASTELYDLYVANGGTGRKPTDPEPDRIVQAIADAIRANEAKVNSIEVISLRERLKRHPEGAYDVVRA